MTEWKDAMNRYLRTALFFIGGVLGLFAASHISTASARIQPPSGANAPEVCQCVTGSISGFVYTDVNNNGGRDSGEPGIAGVTIALSGDESQTTATDANDAYTFFITTFGCCDYTVTETQPAGFADGIDSVGTGDCGAGTLGNDVFTNICIDGDDAVNYNFGELPLTTPTATETPRKLRTHTPTSTPTRLPARSTPTPQPATSTPVVVAATRPSGGAAGAVRAPDTGNGGPGSSGTRSVREFALFAFGLVAAGLAVIGLSILRRAQQRR